MKDSQMKIQYRKLLTVDPSINACGVAIFDIKSKQLDDAILVAPDKLAKSGEWYDKASSVANKVKAIQARCHVTEIVVELPDHWSTAGFAARESGSIEKLAFICGMLYSMRGDVDKFIFTLPRGWKGQLSKDVMKNRIARDYAGKKKHYTEDEWKDLDHNVCDAIGIGHWRLFGRV